MRQLIMMAGAWAMLGAAAHAQGADPNAVYERFAAAYNARDAQTLVTTAYAEDAIYVRGDAASLATGRDAILGVYSPMFANMTSNAETPQLSFRLAARSATEDMITDVGWYRLRITDAEGEVLNTSYGRFLTVMTKTDEGEWTFLRDLDTGATEALWDAQTPVEGLHFDE